MKHLTCTLKSFWQTWLWVWFPCRHHHTGLVVKADPGFDPRLRRDFSGSSHTSDLRIGIPVAAAPGIWHYRVCAGTGWLVVSILWLGEMKSLIYNFYLSVAACTIVWADLSLRYTSMLLGRLASNQQTNPWWPCVRMGCQHCHHHTSSFWPE